MKLAKLNNAPEIFHSIQGEGRSLGRPSVFVRASLCNLHCVWCDTDYTWNWVGTRFRHVRDDEPGYSKYRMEDVIVDLTPEEVVRNVMRFDCRNVIFTGGEPFLQQEEILDVMKLLKSRDSGYTFEIETNGTIIPLTGIDALVDQYNVSPKLENSGNSRRLREKPKVYRYFADNPKAFFKFVVAARKDIDEILELKEKYNIPPGRIYLMPEGTSPESLQQKELWAVELCKKFGFNLTTRLHIHVFGNKRGV
jgi:7-carboxy-7-deazaguanine synthase